MSIKSEEIVAFAQQLSNMIDAGLALSKSLCALEKEEERGELKKVIGRVRQDVDEGTTLSEALARHPRVFSEFFVNMIFAGEQGAGLPMALRRVTEHLQKENSLRSKIMGAFAYPMVVGIFALLIITFLVVVVAPVFAKVYSQLGVVLPLPTRLLLYVSFAVRRLWWIFLGGAASLYISCRYFGKKAAAKEFMDRALMNLPVFGKIVRKMAVARFVRAFGDMLECNLTLNDSLAIVDKLVGNRVVSAVVEKIKATVQGGGTLSQAMSASQFFSAVVVQMAYAGEEGGNIGMMLGKCAETLEQDLENSAKKLVLIIEPSLTLILAGIVGFIALSIYLPMFDLMKVVSK